MVTDHWSQGAPRHRQAAEGLAAARHHLEQLAPMVCRRNGVAILRFAFANDCLGPGAAGPQPQSGERSSGGGAGLGGFHSGRFRRPRAPRALRSVRSGRRSAEPNGPNEPDEPNASVPTWANLSQPQTPPHYPNELNEPNEPNQPNAPTQRRPGVRSVPTEWLCHHVLAAGGRANPSPHAAQIPGHRNKWPARVATCLRALGSWGGLG
jgi:hypothetical protein